MIPFHEDAPNPQFVRQPMVDLTGTWSFRYDDDDVGLRQEWWQSAWGDACRQIVVPYPPESERSGIGDPSFHPVVWYQRDLSNLPIDGERTLIRFGAVDFHATVWVGNVCVGQHEGGSSPFAVEVDTAWLLSLESPLLTVRAFDHPTDLEQPRGKQGWLPEPNGIWYKRTTGIWQPVWLESVPAIHIEHVHWVFDVDSSAVRFELELNRIPLASVACTLTIESPTGALVSTEMSAEARITAGTIDLAGLTTDGDLESVLWSPNSPTLLPTRITTSTGDRVDGYIGLRSVGLDRNGFTINGQPHWMRLVLSQGYFQESCYAAPSAEAIKREVELTLALGFNGARTHQKAEDPRYLYWADKLGMMVWGEIGAAYAWSDLAIARLSNEWRELVRRDLNHPSIVAWVPFNESWGIHEVSAETRQQDGVRSLYALTNALDGTRPVIGNDGWEHVSSDVFSLHDYNWSGDELRARYSSGKSNAAIATTYTEAGKNALAAAVASLDALPLMISEYGGVSFAPAGEEDWYGYGKVTTDQEFAEKYRELTSALHDSNEVVGVCYTQLTDTEQETNGLLTEKREPKIDIALLTEITRGTRG